MSTESYAQAADRYFGEEGNRPFSILECCGAMGIDHHTLADWESGGDEGLRALALRIKGRVAAGWEKGELSPTLSVHLHRHYLGGGGRAGPARPMGLTLRVVDHDA